MDLIKIVNINNDKEKVVKKLREGEVGVILSDTIYGLSCSINNPLAIDKIYRIKNRPKTKFFVLLISDFLMLRKYFLISKEQESFLKNIWLNNKTPPTTFILEPRKDFMEKIHIKKYSGLAVRLPKDDFLIKIIKSLACPLVSTSCNISGQRELNNLREIISLFKFNRYKPDFIVNYNKAKSRRKSSTIMDIRRFPIIKLIRS